MKNSTALTVTSLLSIVLFSIHLADDMARGFEPGTLPNLGGVLIMVVWLLGTLTFTERKSGRVIVLLLSFLGAGVPIVHFKGKGVAAVAKSSGGLFFVWTLLALGITALCAFMLSIDGLWSLRRRRGGAVMAAGSAVETGP